MGDYLDSSDRPDRIAGGVRMIPVTTPVGDFRVWTKRVGSNPDLTVLLLHGGPGATHEYLETCDGYLPAAGIEYYFYDQLGSFYSDQPDDPSLWEIDRFVDEVEQVRLALGLGPEQLRAVRAVVGRRARDRVRARAPAAPQGPRGLEHDGEHPGVQPVRRGGAHAGDGPGRAGRDQAARGRGRDLGPGVRGVADGAPLRAPRVPAARGRVARPGGAGLRAHQPGDLRPDAGPERARRQREARATGTGRRTSSASTCRRW